MNTTTTVFPEKVIREATALREQARTLRKRADEIEDRAYKIQETATKEVMREQSDKWLSKAEALELLWFDSYPALRRWEKKLNPIGYLRFNDNKILRSQVLRCIDDYRSGVIERKLRGLN